MKLSTLSLLHQEVMKVQNKKLSDSLKKKLPKLLEADPVLVEELAKDIASYKNNINQYVQDMLQERAETLKMYKNECHRLNNLLELLSKSTLKTIQRELWMTKTHNS